MGILKGTENNLSHLSDDHVSNHPWFFPVGKSNIHMQKYDYGFCMNVSEAHFKCLD